MQTDIFREERKAYYRPYVSPKADGVRGQIACSTAALGRSGELRASAELLERGWNVYAPEVDCDGVDLVAERDGRRITVQVKASRMTRLGQYNFSFRKSATGRNSAGREMPIRADFCLCYAAEAAVWFVFPLAALQARCCFGEKMVMLHLLEKPPGSPGRQRSKRDTFRFREAWHLLDDPPGGGV